MQTSLPETLVLFAPVHGSLTVTEKDTGVFQLPKDMSIIRLMVARPGTCNITNQDQIEKVASVIQSGPITSEDDVKRLAQSIAPIIKVMRRDVADEIDEFPDGKQFLDTNLVTPAVVSFQPGTTMMNKTLERDRREGKTKYDSRLNIMNMPYHDGKPIDLFDIFPLMDKEGATTRYDAKTMGRQSLLSTLIDMLKQHGVKKVIFIDLSCSGFKDGLFSSPREERYVRQSLEKMKAGKRKTRRVKRKTKTRRTKKQISQWIL